MVVGADNKAIYREVDARRARSTACASSPRAWSRASASSSTACSACGPARCVAPQPVRWTQPELQRAAEARSPALTHGSRGSSHESLQVLHRPADLRRRAVGADLRRRPASRCACCRSPSIPRSCRRRWWCARSIPGANPKVIAETVATPLEEQINGVEDMLYMSSARRPPTALMTLTVTFQLGTDLDKAQELVQNRVSQAEPRLPEEVRRLGVTTVKSSPDLTMVVHLLSPNDRYDMTYLRNYARAQRQGPAGAHRRRRRGAAVRPGDYSMRVWLDPQKVAARGLSAERRRARDPRAERAGRGRRGRRVAGACRASTCSSRSTRRAGCRPRRSSATSSSRPAPNGEVTRLRDVARIELGAADYALRSLLDNKPAVGDRRSSRRPARTRSQISDNVRATMAELKKNMPEGVDYEHRLRPDAVRARLDRGGRAHAARGDRAGRARGDPVPADLARLDHPAARGAGVDRRHVRGDATLFGFSINALTLFGLVLAIGIVVDDAIVVVENVERNIEDGLSPREATYQAMQRGDRPDHRDRAGAVRGVRAARVHQRPDRPVLPAVRADHRDLDGDLGVQLADAVAGAGGAAAASAHDAPKDCADARHGPRCSAGSSARFNRVFQRGVDALQRRRRRASARKALIAWSSTSALLGADRFGCSRRCPSGFVPAQDKQYLVGFAQLPDGATLDRTEDVIRRMGEIALKTAGRRERGRASRACRSTASPTAPNAGIVFVDAEAVRRAQARRA